MEGGAILPLLFWSALGQQSLQAPAPSGSVTPYTPMGPGRGRERRAVAALFAQRTMTEDGD